jgi:hypothetical protein
VVEKKEEGLPFALESMRPRPLARGVEIHERQAFFDPVDRQGAGGFVAVVRG